MTVAPSKECPGPYCRNTQILASADLCTACGARADREAERGLKTIDNLLSLEAKFVVYCEEHGLPHPHK